MANEGADLPDLPERFGAERVTFPPNEKYERGSQSMDVFWDEVRLDRGRRVLAGMLAARDSRFFMIVDDDDFVSARIAQHASENTDANGWTINFGYVWSDGGRLLIQHDNFFWLCGTSLIVRSDLYDLPARLQEASACWIKTMLGSHKIIVDILAKRGTQLAQLPFRGAVYRVAHAGSHSRAPGLWVTYFWKEIRRPRKLLRNAGKLRVINSAIRREFGMR